MMPALKVPTLRGDAVECGLMQHLRSGTRLRRCEQ